jgi:hypothetical protein
VASRAVLSSTELVSYTKVSEGHIFTSSIPMDFTAVKQSVFAMEQSIEPKTNGVAER